MSEETSTTAPVAAETATTTETAVTTNNATPNILAGASTVGKPEFVPDKFWNKEKGEANIEGLSKSYSELEKRLGSTRPTVPDFEKATPEEQKAFWQSLGASDKAEDYTVNIPEGMPTDPKFLSSFQQFAAENSIPKPIAEKLAGWYLGQQGEAITSWNNQIKEVEKTLKNEWGGDYQKNIDGSWNTLKTLVGNDQANQMLDRYGSDVAFIKMLNNINAKISEDSVKEPTVNIGSIATSNDEMKKEYTSIKTDKSHPLNAAFWNAQHPQRQEVIDRMSELQKKIKW